MGDAREGCFVLVGLATLIALVIGLSIALKAYSCGQRWSDFDNDWSLFSGCRVKIDGRWIPEDRVRELEPTEQVQP